MLDRYEAHHLGMCIEPINSTSLDPTGFKYIGNTALDLAKTGLHVPFGYEEAIGFMFGDEIRDKDGVAATVRSLGVMKFAFGSDIKHSRWRSLSSQACFTAMARPSSRTWASCMNVMDTSRSVPLFQQGFDSKWIN
jgi:hypothetical protein